MFQYIIMSLSVSVPRELTRQQAGVAEDLEVIVHPKLAEAVKAVHGLSMGQPVSMQGLASINWHGLNSDQGIDYTSPVNWYGVIRPLGRLGEREAIAGWRAFFSEVQGVFQRLSIKYLSDDAQGYVIFPLENYRQMRLYCTEISALLAELKSTQRAYWPCVFAIAEQRGMFYHPIQIFVCSFLADRYARRLRNPQTPAAAPAGSGSSVAQEPVGA